MGLSVCDAHNARMTGIIISACNPKELARELERLMREKRLERPAALRKLLRTGLRDRVENAVSALGREKLSLSRVAEDARVSVR